MVAENTEDGEGELLRRIRGIVGDELPIVASLDYHANLTPEMAQARHGAGRLSHLSAHRHGGDRQARRRAARPAAQGEAAGLSRLSPARFPDPAGLAVHLHRAGQGASSTWWASSRPARRATTRASSASPTRRAFRRPTSPSAGRRWWSTATTRKRSRRRPTSSPQTVKAQEKAFAGELLDPDAAALRAIELAKKAKKPIVLADVQDNPGAGGTSDTVGLLAALMRHKAQGRGDRHDRRRGGGQGGRRDRRGQRHAPRHRRRRRLCRREAGRGRLARGQGRRAASSPAPARSTAARSSRSARWRW